jgi:hypothetical protein
MKIFFIQFGLLVSSFIAIAQVRLSPNIILPKDSSKTQMLITSLNGFLSQKDSANESNTYVLKDNLLETSILLDEFKHIEVSDEHKDNKFYKPYLNNIVVIDSQSFLIQLSYIGQKDNASDLAAVFEMIAIEKDNKYFFNSPLKKNTKFWKVKRLPKTTFYFKDKLNANKAKEFNDKIEDFDTKLNLKNIKTEWYGCEDIHEVLSLFGVKYHANYNGRKHVSGFTTTQNNTHLILSGENNEAFDHFDPHDLWHSRSGMVIPRAKYHKATDCAYAHLVGGSWGISWETIWKMFKERVASDKNKNWLDEYGKWQNFGDSPDKHLRTEYILNALLTEMIEKKYGMDKVIEFMSIGPYSKTNENYFSALERITGITKATYNQELWKLINQKL